MDVLLTPSPARLLADVARCVPAMRSRAAELDRRASIPADDLDALRMAGCLAAPVPARLGGLGIGTEPAGAGAALALLRGLGRGNLSVGRIVEGHINALRLVMIYGNEAQRHRAADEALDGHLFALWIAEGEKLRLTGAPPRRVLAGVKTFGSAVGAATRAMVTAADEAGQSWMVMIGTHDAGVSTEALAQPPQGMRSAGTGRIVFHDSPVPPGALLGVPGDYLREPEFSAGAWRASAVALGGLDALIEEARAQLLARGRDADPHQLARMGHALIAQETASLWMRKAAVIADGAAGEPADRNAYVNLARTAVETACLDAMRLVQRSLGLAAFVPPNPIERLARDLGTFLRQPMPDQALTDGAARYIRHDLPRDPPDAEEARA